MIFEILEQREYKNFLCSPIKSKCCFADIPNFTGTGTGSGTGSGTGTGTITGTGTKKEIKESQKATAKWDASAYEATAKNLDTQMEQASDLYVKSVNDDYDTLKDQTNQNIQTQGAEWFGNQQTALRAGHNLYNSLGNTGAAYASGGDIAQKLYKMYTDAADVEVLNTQRENQNNIDNTYNASVDSAETSFEQTASNLEASDRSAQLSTATNLFNIGDSKSYSSSSSSGTSSSSTSVSGNTTLGEFAKAYGWMDKNGNFQYKNIPDYLKNAVRQIYSVSGNPVLRAGANETGFSRSTQELQERYG